MSLANGDGFDGLSISTGITIQYVIRNIGTMPIELTQAVLIGPSRRFVSNQFARQHESLRTVEPGESKELVMGWEFRTQHVGDAIGDRPHLELVFRRGNTLRTITIDYAKVPRP